MDVLNNDVLNCVFGWALCVSPLIIEGFRKDINMLQVSRRWRQMLAPRVYKQVYIKSVDGHRTALQTNIDLAAANSCLNHCRHVIIKIRSSNGIFSKIYNAISQMQRYSNAWTLVSQLTIILEDHRVVDASSIGVAVGSEEISRTARYIAHVLPNISRLRITSVMEDGRISTLLNLLIDRYKNNLVDIATKAGQVNLVEVPRLKRVKIMFSRSVDLTFSLQICDTVEYLNLAIVPHEYLCSLFGSHGSPKVFPNLQYLNVYSPLDCIDSATEELVQRHISCSRLYLPKLRSLILVNNYKYCPILSTAVLPRQMDILSVSVSPQTIMMLAKSAIPQVQQLSIQQHMCTDIERGSTVAALRHIFHQTSIAANAMLTFDSPTRSIMPSELGGACITYLSVRRGVTLTMLAEFMNSLYALTRLEAHLCQQCKSELELATPDKAEHPLRPFAARINHFRLDYDYSTDSIVPFIRYILPRLPHIETLDSYMTFREPIVQFVEEYKSLYPHLSIVKLVLNPSNLW